MTATEHATATILPFPAHARALQRLSTREPWARLEREAAEGCEAASGACYHDAAIREDLRAER